MTFQFGQDLELDQLRTNHNITVILSGKVRTGMSSCQSKILTAPSGKKECVSHLRLERDHDNRVMTKRRVVGSFSSITPINSSSYSFHNLIKFQEGK